MNLKSCCSIKKKIKKNPSLGPKWSGCACVWMNNMNSWEHSINRSLYYTGSIESASRLSLYRQVELVTHCEREKEIGRYRKLIKLFISLTKLHPKTNAASVRLKKQIESVMIRLIRWKWSEMATSILSTSDSRLGAEYKIDFGTLSLVDRRAELII